MELKGKKVLVVGCGKSGLGAAQLLIQAGAQPILFDENPDLDAAALRRKEEFLADVPIFLKALPEERIGQLDLVVASPGIPVDSPALGRFFDAGIPVWGEVELAWNCEKGQVAAITGTNGKTTTTALVGEIMKRHFSSVFVVGNIGTAYTAKALQTGRDSVTVAEISSFQLETVHSFHPRVSAILNITPDHLNRHHTMENYAAVKESIAKNQTKEDFCILNYDDTRLREFAGSCPAR